MGEQGWGGTGGGGEQGLGSHSSCAQPRPMAEGWWELGGSRRPLFPEPLERQAGLMAALHTSPVLSMSTFVSETTTSQEYWSSSNTAVTSSEYSLPKSSQPRKQAMTTTTSSQGLSRAPKVIQFSDLNQSVIETTPPCSQKRHSSKAEAPQSPKPKPKKTGPPRSPGKQGPGQSCRVTEAPEGPKSSKKRADLSPRQRVRRAKAVRAQSWRAKSQKSAKTSSKTLLPHGRGGSNSSEAQSQSSGPSKAEEASSYTESTATSSSKADTFSDPSSHLGRPKHSQDQSLSPGKAELSPTPSHSATP